LLRQLARKFGGIDARHRDVRAETRNYECAKREQNALPELGCLAKAAEIEIGGQLFGC
jgi:hypothetical protein